MRGKDVKAPKQAPRPAARVHAAAEYGIIGMIPQAGREPAEAAAMPRTDAGGSGGRSPQVRHAVWRQIYLFRGGSRKAQAVTAGKGKPMPENYRMQMERVLKENSARRPRLLLHSCCGPCSSAVLEALCPHFEVTVDYYNPNIDTAEDCGRTLCRRYAGAGGPL